MKVVSTSESLIRTTDPRVSVFAAAERRKCCDISRIRVLVREYAIFDTFCQRESSRICYFAIARVDENSMDFQEAEKIWIDRAKRFLKAELKRADVTYEELARRLREHHRLNETKISVANKLSRGTFSAAFFLAAMKAIGREQLNLTDL